MSKLLSLDDKRIVSNDHKPLYEDIRYGCMLLIDKPHGWTSFDVVNKVRSCLKYSPGIKKVKVGHAGTLDPLATGLLLVCIGKYTKLIDKLTGKNKSYLADIKLGATTKTYDRESEEENIISTENISEEALKEAACGFIGTNHQLPPVYSAIKVNGVSAHRLARRGKDVELKSRKVEIIQFEITDWNNPMLKAHITCSKGTYIRSLAHDLGQSLGCGGYLHDLRRTSIGMYNLDNAMNIDEVITWINLLPESQKELGHN